MELNTFEILEVVVCCNVCCYFMNYLYIRGVYLLTSFELLNCPRLNRRVLNSDCPFTYCLNGLNICPTSSRQNVLLFESGVEPFVASKSMNLLFYDCFEVLKSYLAPLFHQKENEPRDDI